MHFKLEKGSFPSPTSSSQAGLISPAQSWGYPHRSSSASKTHYKIDLTAQRREYTGRREAQERPTLDVVQNSALQGFDMFA